MIFANLDEFWPYYVAQHLNPTNRRLHFVGTTLGLLCAAAAFVLARPVLILAALACGYGFAWIGHFGFERNTPATFKYTKLSFAADFRMYALMWRGKMTEEAARLAPELRRFRAEELL